MPGSDDCALCWMIHRARPCTRRLAHSRPTRPFAHGRRHARRPGARRMSTSTDHIARSALARVITVDRGVATARTDMLAGEEPLQIMAAGPGRTAVEVAVTMRTPGHEDELAIGFLVTEGLAGPDDIVRVDARRPGRRRPDRTTRSSSTCGGRWTSAGSPSGAPWRRPAAASAARPASRTSCVVATRSRPARVIDRAMLPLLPGRLRAAQETFDSTGGLHASGLFDAAGDLVLAARGCRTAQRAGQGHRRVASWPARCRSTTRSCWSAAGSASSWSRRRRWPASRCWRAVGAPTDLAVDTAERLGMTLVGFLRGERYNVYSRPDRLGLERMTASTDPHARPPKKRARRLAPDLWVSLRPNGIGLQKPNHFGEMARTVWENRHALPYAWRILSQGVCDGCALGVAGFHDWTIDGIHLCTTRLNLLKLNTMRADGHRPPGRRRGAARAVERASCASSAGSPTPCSAGAASRASRAISWDAALALVADRIRAARAKERRRRRSPRLLPDRAGHHQRGLLRGPEGGPVPGHQQRRQRGPDLPRAVHERAQGRHRRGRDHRAPTPTSSSRTSSCSSAPTSPTPSRCS